MRNGETRGRDTGKQKQVVFRNNDEKKPGGGKGQPKQNDGRKETTFRKGEQRETPVKKSKSRCKAFGQCAGCQMIDLPYKEQLEQKQRRLMQLLSPFVKLEPIVGMEEPEHYRHKVQAVFTHDKNGKPLSGVYKEGSRYIIPIESCYLEHKKADEIIGSIRGLLPSFKIKTYNEDSDYGLLRHVMVRVGHESGQIMVVLVLASPILPSKANFVKALRKLHPEITTIVINVNDKRTSMVLGDKEQVIYGKGYIEDTLCGKVFKLSSKSFYQMNPVQAKKLYEKAFGYAKLTGSETILDAYCGIGTIGIIAGDRAKRVIGVEQNRDAVRDAIANAKLNQQRNVDFYHKDAGEFMVQLAGQGENVDVVFMEPPRAGSDEVFLGALAKLAPKKVVYISCNPESLARDLVYLKKVGYQVVCGGGIDVLPFTNHVETCVLLSHKKPDGHINIKVEFGEGEGKVPLDNIVKRAEIYKEKESVTYQMIKEYIVAKYGFKVHNAYIAEVKRDLGLPMYDAPNAVEELKHPRKHPTAEKVEAIKDALRYFKVI